MSEVVMRASARRPLLRLAACAGGLAALMAMAGCHNDMWVQNKVNRPEAASNFLPDGMSARPLLAHTVARGHLQDDPVYFTGITSGTPIPIDIRTGQPTDTTQFRGTYTTAIPRRALVSFTGNTDQERMKAMLLRGQDRFNIYCAPCHGRLGNGLGMIAQRGFLLRKPPANYHTERLRRAPIGHFYDVITNGYGIMFSYAERIQDPNDRWAIAAYIRALQLSENATPADVPANVLPQLQTQPYVLEQNAQAGK